MSWIAASLSFFCLPCYYYLYFLYFLLAFYYQNITASMLKQNTHGEIWRSWNFSEESTSDLCTFSGENDRVLWISWPPSCEVNTLFEKMSIYDEPSLIILYETIRSNLICVNSSALVIIAGRITMTSPTYSYM